MKLTESEKRIVRTALKPDSTLGILGKAVGMAWVLVSLFLADYIGRYLSLVYFYGFVRVHKEGLHFTHRASKSRTADYILSNGDHKGFYDAWISAGCD